MGDCPDDAKARFVA
jgi:hypothetical protein